jgi:hypothetical protein
LHEATLDGARYGSSESRSISGSSMKAPAPASSGSRDAGGGLSAGENPVSRPDDSECRPGIDSRWRESVNIRGAAQGRAVGGAPANIAD